MFVIIRASVLWQFGPFRWLAALDLFWQSGANCDWSVASVPISSGRIPAAEAMSEAERRMRHHDVKMLYEKALQCDGWGDVRERPDPRTALTRPTRAPGESAVFY